MLDKEKVPAIRFKGFTDAWEQRKLGEILKYEQPTNYIVDSTEYSNEYTTPVLTAGQSFILGYTDENYGIKKADENNPVIIFDDFTTSSHIVDFPFKVKSSAMKLLTLKDEKDDFYFALNTLKNFDYTPQNHERHWISKFSAFSISIPSEEEQAKIGSFFAMIDNLITLHQRKLLKLRTVKKAMLEKMFPKNGSHVPEIRFAGFTDAWEQRKLKEIADKVTEKNAKLQFTETFTNSAEFGIISQRDYFDHDISNEDNLGSYYVVRNEDFIYNPRISTFAPVGPINRNKLGRNGVMSPLYTVFRTHDINNTFLEQYFRSIYWHSFMKLNGDSGARSDRFSIKDSVLIEMPIPYPGLKEQLKIGEYLTKLDNLITLHQRKYEKLQNLKKACLEKMFV